jgi:hypothetical protein
MVKCEVIEIKSKDSSFKFSNKNSIQKQIDKANKAYSNGKGVYYLK